MEPCKNGHTEGRYHNGVCKECSRNQGRRHNEKRRRARNLGARTNLPLPPLRDLLRMRALEHADEMGHGGGNGYRALTRRLAPELGQPVTSVDRTLARLLNKQTKYVSWHVADAWCCAMGVHISAIYTEAELNGEWEWVEEYKPPRPRCACGRAILAKGWDKCHVCRDADMNFKCKHCGKGLISDHGLFLHSSQVHGDKSQGRHTWHSNKAVVG